MKLTWHNEKRKISELVPYVANPRQITDKQAQDLKASLDKFGLADPLIVNTNNDLIGGHQRKKILETLMGADPDFEVDVRVPDRELTIDEMRELNVRLNKNVAEWNFDTLANNFELDDLLEWGFDKAELDLDLWMAEPADDPGAQMDKAEELREKWGVETGQLWQLGEHRLICGDCTDEAVVERVMGGERADILFTDPPYGVGVVGDGGNIGGDTKYAKAGKYQSVIGDDKLFSPEHMFGLAEHLIIWGANYFCMNLPTPGQWVVWDKNRPKGTTFSDCELAWTNGDGKAIKKYKCTWDGFHREGERGERLHPTQKPVKLCQEIIGDFQGEKVLDVYLGSGTTLIACERLNRKCRAVEISPAYCAVAIQRWVDMTGGEPVLVQDEPSL